MLQYNPTVSGSLNITGSLQVSGDITGTVNGINITGLSQSVSSQLVTVQSSTGSSDAKFETLSGVTSSALTRLTNIESKSASVDISISNINSVTASNIARLSNLETKSSSVDISISNINSFTSSNDTKFTTLGTYTGSLDTKNTTLAAVTSSLISKTGSYATTGSNSFFGTQVFSGSVYIANDLVVQGSSSIQYISASSVSIGTNIVQLNTANPSVRFAGLTIIDSGSIGGSGSFLYDSVHDEFVFVHRGNGTNVTSSHFVLGPETYDSLGNETYLTCNVLTKGTGKEHLVDSCIFDNGTTTCIKNNLIGTGTISGTTIYGSTAVCSAVGKFTNCIDITSAATTGTALRINGDNLTTGTALSIVSNDGSVSHTGNLVEICNAFNAGAAAKLMCLYQGDDGDGIYINMARGGVGLTVDGAGGGYSAIFNNGNVGIGTITPASLLSAYNTTSTAISQMYISNPASNGTGGGNRGFDTSFTSTLTSFTGTDNGDQGYGYFPLTIVNGQTYTIHFKSTAVNGTLGTIITSTGTNFATDSVQTISLPTITDGTLTSIRFTATGAATYIGFAGYRTSGTMSLTISEVSIVSGIPDIETGAIVAYKGVATNRINIQSPTTACIPVLGCADCTTGLIISNFDTRYGMLLGSLNTGTGWIQQGRYDGTATSYPLSLNPNGGNVGIGTCSPTSNLHLRDSTNGFVGLRLEGTGTYAGSDWIIYASSLSPSSADDFLGFYNNSTTDGASGGYKMSISKNGNVGINNTTTPCGRLQITLGTVAGGCFRTATGGEAALTIEACGNSYMQFMNCSNAQTGLMFGNNCTAYSGMIWYRHDSKQLMLGAGGTETMYICGGNVGIAMSTPSQKLHLIGGFLQTAGNSSWYRNVFEVNPTSWTNVVGFSPQSNPQYTYGYINITASAYTNGTSAGGVTTSRWYYSITNNSISVTVNGSDIATGSQAPGVRLTVSSGTIYVQVQSNNGTSPAYTSVFVDAMLASGYVNGTYWTIA